MPRAVTGNPLWSVWTTLPLPGRYAPDGESTQTYRKSRAAGIGAARSAFCLL
jgi:hypothetical protein